MVLGGGDEPQPLGARAGEQSGRIGIAERVMIGERLSRRDIDAGRFQRGEELLRTADAGKGEVTPATWLGRRERSTVGRLQHAAQHGAAGARGEAEHTVAALPVADDEHGVGARQLRGERRAQRAGRQHAAIADAHSAIDDDQAQILGERGILEAVIHDDAVGAGGPRAAGRPSDGQARPPPARCRQGAAPRRPTSAASSREGSTRWAEVMRPP